jgi:hypothetical protein
VRWCCPACRSRGIGTSIGVRGLRVDQDSRGCGYVKPPFHDLRKTGAARVEAISSLAVAKAFSDTLTRTLPTPIVASLDAVRDAVN